MLPSRLGQNMLHDMTAVAYGFKNRVYLSNRATDNLSFTQRLKLVSRLDVHNGCVNSICWNESGQYILSGSDDQHLVIVNPFTGKIEASLHTAHRANIFSARFLPNCQDRQTISCSADGLIYYYDFEQPELLSGNGFDCHLGAVYEVLTVPNDSYTFLSCGEDGTVRWFDLRTKTRCIKANCEEDIMINTRQAVMSLAINPMRPFQLAIGCADSTVRIYDRRQLSTGAVGADPSRSGAAMLHCFSAPSVKKRNHRITSLAYGHDGEELLVSYSSEHLYLFNFNNNKEDNHVPLMKSFKDFDDANGALMDSDGCASSDRQSCSSFSEAMTSGEYVFRPCAGRQPPVKRLRLRGDWSDTGPNARPEREREPSQDETASSIMQRMSNMLTRLLEGRMRQGNNDPQASNEVTTDHEPEERTEQDLPEDQVGTDESVLPAESSFSSSEGSSAIFVSCSASDKEASSEDSKEAFEMSECAGSEQFRDGSKEVRTSTFRQGQISDRTSDLENSTEKDEDKIPADGDKSISGNQIHGEVVMLDVMPLSSHCCSDVVSDSSNSTRSSDSCSKICTDRAACVVLSESVAERMNSVSINQQHAAAGHSHEKPFDVSTEKLFGATDVTHGQFSTETDTILNDSETPARLETASFSSDPVSELGFSGGLRDSLMADKSSEDESVRLDKNISASVDTDGSDTFRMSCDGSVNQTEMATECCSSISNPSSGIIRLSQVSMDVANLGKKDPVNKDEISSSMGIIQQQRVTSLSASANDSIDAIDHERRRSSASDRSDDDDDSDSEEALVAPACRKVWSEQRLERKNAAASKLQAVFRQHLEEKKKHQDAGSSLPKPALKQCYLGHRNSRTMIKEASFWGNNYVMSGSDCGHIFIWDRRTAKLVMLLEGDKHVVNCLQPHPHHPILASSGIDYDVKIWMAAHEFPSFDYSGAAELMRRNEVMLEETKDTVTVPASFMLRMLLSLNHARRGRFGGLSRDQSSSRNSSTSSRDD